MNRALAHRLTRLEQQARASVDAVLHGHEAPGHDEGQSQADRARLERWCTVQGVYVTGKAPMPGSTPPSRL